MTRRHLWLLTCTLAVLAIGGGAWSLFAIRSTTAPTASTSALGAPRVGVATPGAPAQAALDAIGVERVPTAVSRDLGTAVLAAGTVVGLVALSWCGRRRDARLLRSDLVVAAAPRGPPRMILT
jgi:hypothetical protein